MIPLLKSYYEAKKWFGFSQVSHGTFDLVFLLVHVFSVCVTTSSVRVLHYEEYGLLFTVLHDYLYAMSTMT